LTRTPPREILLGFNMIAILNRALRLSPRSKEHL
jgi:hypothetical protein